MDWYYMCTRKASLPEANRYFLINKYLSVDLFDDAKVKALENWTKRWWQNNVEKRFIQFLQEKLLFFMHLLRDFQRPHK